MVRLADVAGKGDGLAAGPLDLLLHGFQRLLAPAGEHERVAGIRQRLGRGPADARARAGDEGDFVSVTHCDSILPINRGT